MAIPNTTPTPNELYNGEMKKMGDTELRVVLIITRATLGWVMDKETGMRKAEDWVSHTQLVKKSGRSSPAVSKAVDSCVKQGWIETRNKEGKLLRTPKERERRRVYYRLGRIFLDKVSAKESSADEELNENLPNLTTKSAKVSLSHLPKKLRVTKETVTKEDTVVATQALQTPTTNSLIYLFKEINPSYKQLFKNKTQRSCLERMVKEHGTEKVEWVLKVLPKTNGMKYAPTITTPMQLENRLGELVAFIKKEQGHLNVIKL